MNQIDNYNKTIFALRFIIQGAFFKVLQGEKA